MNFYNPYMGFYPYANVPTKTGILSSLFKGNGFNLGSIISGTQKTLNIINQTIPIVKQVSPVMKNAKTMFKVMNEFKKTDTKEKVATKVTTNNTSSNKPLNNSKEQIEETVYNESNGPTFFI